MTIVPGTSIDVDPEPEMNTLCLRFPSGRVSIQTEEVVRYLASDDGLAPRTRNRVLRYGDPIADEDAIVLRVRLRGEWDANCVSDFREAVRSFHVREALSCV